LKKCEKCGAENKPSAKFCGVCGAVFRKAEAKPILPRFQKMHLVIAAAALAGGVACYFILQGGADNPDGSAAASMTADQLDKKGIDDFTDKNYSASMKWFEKAAAKNDFAAENWIGWFYQQGLGVLADNNQAVSWYTKAASQGYAPSETNLGWCYQNGLGVATDEPQAIQWYRKAVKQGNDSAEINMGYLYEKGIGVVQNDAEAKRWYKMASDQGNQEAQKDLNALEAKGVNLNALLQATTGQ